MSAPDVAGVREGEILAGKYRVDKVLGVGGMGVVVAAYHIELDQRVAIKFLLPEVLDHGEAVARFAREARAAVKIKSEHVAKVTDVGKLENGAPYMVMEFLDGSDLSQWLTQRGALPVEQACEFVLQACEAIAEAHALGIVHRDLKPGNLFVIRRADGVLSVKVLDFGISKTASGPGSGSAGAMTKTSALMGSPLYMSPEQMQSSRRFFKLLFHRSPTCRPSSPRSFRAASRRIRPLASRTSPSSPERSHRLRRRAGDRSSASRACSMCRPSINRNPPHRA